MLLPMLYCISFFVLPAIGMIVLAVKKARLQGEGEDELLRRENTNRRAKVHSQKNSIPRFANSRIIEYQLMESQIHESLHFKHHKQRAPCRAGPYP